MSLRSFVTSAISNRTRRGLTFEVARLRARAFHHIRRAKPTSPHLHLGCGKRKIPGWFNVDVARSDFDIDLAAGTLPFPDAVFDTVVSQQVIEHLELESQLAPLLRELFRVCRPGAELWLTCPDMESISRSYLTDGGGALLADRKTRWPDFSLNGAPASHLMNVLFHQAGEHVNLFDFRLLSWLLEREGFRECVRTNESDFRSRFPEFPGRNDDLFSLYVRVRRP